MNAEQIAEAWDMLLGRWPGVSRLDMATALFLDTLPDGAEVTIDAALEDVDDNELAFPAEAVD